jgi:DNA-binding CsgD family transcriptional regulator
MRDLAPVLDLFAAVEKAMDPDALRRLAVGALADLLPCEHVLWGELDTHAMRPLAAVTSDGTEVDLVAFARHAAAHPLIAHHVRTGDPGPLRLSDFASTRRLRRLGVWDEFYRPLGVDRALCVALASAGSTAVGIAFHRRGRDFDEGERRLVARVRPALSAAVRDARCATIATGGLTGREEQILRMVGAGAANGEIALALEISPRTVEKHLEHVYRKLGVAGRYAAIASERSSSVRP